MTEEGSRLLPDIQQGFASFYRGIASLNGDINPNILNVTIVESLSTRWLVPRLQSFLTMHPKMRVRLEPGNTIKEFNESDFDLAIRLAAQIYEPNDLYKLALLEETGPIKSRAWHPFLNSLELREDKFNKVLEVADTTVTIFNAVLAGQGMAMLRYNLIFEQIHRKSLVQLFDFNFPSVFSYYLVAPLSHFKWEKV